MPEIPIKYLDKESNVKYLVIPGWIINPANKKEGYFINSRTLMRLYGVSATECHIFNEEFDRYKDFPGLIPLVPRLAGDYHRKCYPILIPGECRK